MYRIPGTICTLVEHSVEKKRDRLLKKAKKRNTPTAWKAYRTKRNATTNAIRRSHDNYIPDIIGDLNESTPQDKTCGIKRFYGYIKAAKKKKKRYPAQHTDGKIITTNQDKADATNKQFKDAFTKERTSDIPSLGPSPYPSCCEITLTSPGIIKLLEGLQHHKAAGPDSLPPRIIRDLAQKLGPILSRLFQQLYDTCTIPRAW